MRMRSVDALVGEVLNTEKNGLPMDKGMVLEWLKATPPSAASLVSDTQHAVDDDETKQLW